jgi:2-haloacid dehalogenase
MSAAGQVKALAFDVFGTVVDWRSGVEREARALAQSRGIELDVVDFAAEWRRMYDPAMAEVRAGRRTWTKLDDLHRESLMTLVPKYGLDKLDADELEQLNTCWHRLDPWPDSVPGLTRLRTKYILVTLSNGNVRLLIDMAKHGGLPWDAILGAELSKRYKPQPEAYLSTAELLAVPPEECMMVAAHPTDLDAAAEQGFRTAYIHRPKEYPERPPTSVLPGRYDFVVNDLVELATAMGC